MCMNMYQLMFNTTRIPSAKTDHWATYHDDPEARRKVLVAHKNRFFIVDVYDQSNQLLSVPELEMYDTHHTHTAHTPHARTRTRTHSHYITARACMWCMQAAGEGQVPGEHQGGVGRGRAHQRQPRPVGRGARPPASRYT
jgi:hypothetical protein